jgi:hypothetical protein
MYALDLIRTRQAPLAWGWHIYPGCAWLQEFHLLTFDASKKKYSKKRHQELDKLAQLTALVLFSLLWSDHVDLRQPERSVCQEMAQREQGPERKLTQTNCSQRGHL